MGLTPVLLANSTCASAKLLSKHRETWVPEQVYWLLLRLSLCGKASTLQMPNVQIRTLGL